jgi:hypothetical protein
MEEDANPAQMEKVYAPRNADLYKGAEILRKRRFGRSPMEDIELKTVMNDQQLVEARGSKKPT